MALNKPRRRTYVTGQSLPEITTSFRPFNLAPNEDDADLGSVRAFTVNVRNRANSSVYIREGADGDEVRIDAHEHYPIYEPDGIKDVALRGENGGETVEIRVLVAHNDFSIEDKIDGFLRSLSSYIGTAQRDTTITGQDVDLNIDDSANINVDIEAQNVGDVRTLNREGFNEMRHLADGPFEGTESNTWTLYEDADFDGSLESMSVRVSAPASHETTFDLDGIGARVELDRGSTGTWRTISPYRAHSTFLASRVGGKDIYVANYSASRECVYTYTPDPGLYFEDGDSLRIIVTDDGNTVVGVQTDYNVEVNVEINKRERL